MWPVLTQLQLSGSWGGRQGASSLRNGAPALCDLRARLDLAVNPPPQGFWAPPKCRSRMGPWAGQSWRPVSSLGTKNGVTGRPPPRGAVRVEGAVINPPDAGARQIWVKIQNPYNDIFYPGDTGGSYLALGADRRVLLVARCAPAVPSASQGLSTYTSTGVGYLLMPTAPVLLVEKQCAKGGRCTPGQRGNTVRCLGTSPRFYQHQK